MQTRRLGPAGLLASAQGLGCMGMSQSYGRLDDDESVATIRRALDLGVTLFDTSDVYAGGANEELVGRALNGRRDEALVATKFGVTYDARRTMIVDGRPASVALACERSLRRLGTDHVDLYYLHRVDPSVPIEDTVGAMGELVRDGKVRWLGLSEASASTLRRAFAAHPVSALQSEWSLWTRDIEADVLPTARELGVGVVPYSPLGRGFLTGKITTAAALCDNDVRRANPRFQSPNLDANLLLVDGIRELAARKNCTPGQLALAWVLAQGHDVVPIPGTKRRRYLAENVGALDVTLDAGDLSRLDLLAPPGAAAGERYANAHAYGDTPPPGPAPTRRES